MTQETFSELSSNPSLLEFSRALNQYETSFKKIQILETFFKKSTQTMT